MNQMMHTWKLTPTNTPSALWYLSSARAPIHGRAAGPFEARELAARQFAQWSARAPAQDAAEKDTAASPWFDPDLVHCTEAVDERLAASDEPCVLPE
jgi:hypothetical protein